MMELETNPFIEDLQSEKRAEPCSLVIFGATGDLTARKLLPALYHLALERQLPSRFACVGFARRPKTHEAFREDMHDALKEFSRSSSTDNTLWEQFQEKIYYHQSNIDDDDGYQRLGELLNSIDAKHGTKGNRVYYLATQPSFFPAIIEKLSQHRLIYSPEEAPLRWSRVIFEKPFGNNLDSAESLQRHILRFLDESQIYRIDHYLGKETVQNLLLFRFGNSIFDSVWSHRYIEHVQISVAESIGIGRRGQFWEEAGMIRDIVQNHMIQLLSLVAMEPPINLQAKAIRDEKVKVLECIRPINFKDVVRGQYGKGYIDGLEAIGYREEALVSPNSSVETYVALKLNVDNWRWSGVPFYLRAGKRLPKRVTEIAITFKHLPHTLFHQHTASGSPNVLIIRIQPDEGISLRMNCKVPGPQHPIHPVKMDFLYGSYFGTTPPEAYERLVFDSIVGDSTLFARSDEVMTSWKLFTPLLKHWHHTPTLDFPNYACGTWGPDAADQLLKQGGHQWRLL